jgi:hypothetical protein
MPEQFFSSILLVLRRPSFLISRLLMYTAIMLAVTVVMFITYTTTQYVSQNSTYVVSLSFSTAESALEVGRTVRLSWNSVRTVVPDVALVWNTVFLIVADLAEQVRTAVCPTWPPRNIQDDCPVLYEAVSFFKTIVSYAQAFYYLLKAFCDALLVLLKPIICYNIPDCELNYLLLFKWLLEFVRWFLVDFLGSLARGIKYIFLDVLNESIVDGTIDFRSLWNVIVGSVTVIIKAFVRLFANLILAPADRLVCSVFVQPVQCFLRDSCNLIFRDFDLELSALCVWRPIKKIWSCPVVRIRLSFVCKLFNSAGPCYCTACKNLLGIGVPCVVGDATCSCKPKYTLYDEIKPIVDILGLSF